MKVTREWLGHYFDTPLPSVAELDDALTFHAFEIDAVEGDMLDVKVLPNRAADCLSMNGIAGELSAILGKPLKYAPLRDALPEWPVASEIAVAIEAPECRRYMAALVKGVKVGPSPAWLKEALESVGQRSINNVVDAMNFVMLDIGQPLHAFDAAKIGGTTIKVRKAAEGEKITVLTGQEYALLASALVIASGDGAPLAIAGIKGGKQAEVNEETVDIIIESANFDGATTRRAAQALKLFTDASLRFQNNPSPELAAYGLAAALRTIEKVAGGTLAGVVDVYPQKAPAPAAVATSLAQINARLGADFSIDEVLGVLKRLGLAVEQEGKALKVTPPFERTDITIPEDIAEEVGRILGYERVLPVELPAPSTAADQDRFRGMERMKDQLVEQGFIEVSTQSFAKKGDIQLANPLDKARPYLRTSLEENIKDALARAKQYAPLVLAPGEKPKLFEVGTVFPSAGEYVELRMSEVAWEGVPTFDNLTVAKLEDYGKDYTPKRYELGTYNPFSTYPFIARDIAAWIPADRSEDASRAEFIDILTTAIGNTLFTKIDFLDQFAKDGKTSLAFRLVFQSLTRTLTDEEVNSIMDKVAAGLRVAGYEPR